MEKSKVYKLTDNGNIIKCPKCSGDIWTRICSNEFKCLHCCYSFMIMNNKEKAQKIAKEKAKQNENKSGYN